MNKTPPHGVKARHLADNPAKANNTPLGLLNATPAQSNTQTDTQRPMKEAYLTLQVSTATTRCAAFPSIHFVLRAMIYTYYLRRTSSHTAISAVWGQDSGAHEQKAIYGGV
jgi:hypothetical protein